MFSRTKRAGAVALLAAPIVVIIATLVQPTLSGDAATQVTELTDHRAAMIAALTLSTIGVVLLIGGVVWLALALAPRVPRLAVAGGVLGVFGALLVLFLNSIGAAAPAIVSTLDRTQAATVLDHIHSSAVLAALEPLQLVGDIGIALLGIAVVKAGVARWAGAAIAVGAIGEGAGFATSSKAVVTISFALLFAGLLQAVRTLATSPTSVPAAAQEAAAVS